MTQEITHRGSLGRVPQPDTTCASRCQDPALGTERERVDQSAHGIHGLCHLSAGGGVPEPDNPVVVRDGQGPPVRVEGDGGRPAGLGSSRPIRWRLVGSQRSTPPALLKRNRMEANRSPSGLNARASTSRSRRTGGSALPSIRCHNRTAPSDPAVANRSPAALNPTELTSEPAPGSGVPLPSCPSASNSWTPSGPEATPARPSGLSAMSKNPSRSRIRVSGEDFPVRTSQKCTQG